MAVETVGPVGEIEFLPKEKEERMKNFISSEPCTCCGHDVEGEVCYHHEYGQKAFPEYKYEKWNLVSVCLKHHNEIHNKGSIEASVKYKNLERWFLVNGWAILKLEHGEPKWIHELI